MLNSRGFDEMKRALLGTTAVVLAFGLGVPAVAQDYTKLADASDGKGSRIESITVTAQKRVQKAQDVGIALSVLTPEDLDAKNIKTVNQLQYSVPNFESVPAFGSGQVWFRLRGVGFNTYSSNNSSTVAVYVDEVAYPVSASTQGLLYDVSRVEVLRGPQGTLYGRNTTGGAINFVTNKPTDTYTAGVELDYGSHHEFKGEGYVSGPIADGLKVRLSAVTDEGGAWQKNRTTGQSLGSKDQAAFRGQLEWDANSWLNFLLTANWSYDHSEPVGPHRFTAVGDQPADTFVKATDWGGSTVFQSLTGITTTEKPFHNSQNQGVSLHTNADLGFATLTSITSWNFLRRREFNDWDASAYAYAGTYFDTRAGVLSQELRLASKDSGPLSWLAGIYYSNEKIDEHFYSDFWDIWAFAAQTTYQQYVNSVAAYAQVEYAFNDQWKLTGGLRAESEVRKQENYITRALNGLGQPLQDYGTPSNKRLVADPLTGKAELDYKPVDNALVYASVSYGVKSGGFTAYNVPNTQVLDPAKPENIWAYEGGFKTSWLNDTFQLNGAAFYYDYHNQQVQSIIWVPTYGAIGSLVNAKKSHIYGVELEGLWHPTAALTLSQYFGFKEGEFDTFDNYVSSAASKAAGHQVYTDISGTKEPIPKISYGGSVSYRIDLGDFDLEPEFNYAYRDREGSLLTVAHIDSYWLANANLTLSPKTGPWELSLYGRNIFNSRYDLSHNYFVALSAGQVNIATSGEPETFGVRAKYRY
jgi:outer membrane receptor protein involved in Fe transport